MAKNQLYYLQTQISNDQQEHLGQVIEGNKMQTICVLGNTTITVLDQMNKSVPQIMCLVEQASHHILPVGIVVNKCLVNPMSKVVPIILINSNKYNVWIRQHLLPAELYDI